MKKVLDIAENMKNEEFKTEDDLIVLPISEERALEEVSELIKVILTEKYDDQNFFRLMIKFDKKQSKPYENID